MIAESRAALNAAGLALVTLGFSYEKLEADEFGRVCVTYRLVHVSGEHLDFNASTAVIPEKGRPQDKAEATALTYNLGYFLRGLLLLPREEEGAAVDARDDRKHEPTPAVAVKVDPAMTLKAEEFRVRILDAQTEAELKVVGNEIQAANLPAQFAKKLGEHYKARRAACQTGAAS